MLAVYHRSYLGVNQGLGNTGYFLYYGRWESMENVNSALRILEERFPRLNFDITSLPYDIFRNSYPEWPYDITRLHPIPELPPFDLEPSEEERNISKPFPGQCPRHQ